MKLFILLVFILSPASVCAQTVEPFEGIALSWLERRYWTMASEKFNAVEKKHNELQAKLQESIAAPTYPEQQRDIFFLKTDIAIHQKTYDEARDEFAKVKELFVKASTDKAARKMLNKELKAALRKENNQTSAENSAYRSKYPNPYPSTFTVRCYSGGVGRYFWVRCRSSRY